MERDNSDSRAEVDKSLTRLREIARLINKATNDRQTQAKIQRAWQLQDILIFPKTSAAPLTPRVLGFATLCGVLYVAYQSESNPNGEYMLCVLFQAYLLLAKPNADFIHYEVVALVSLNDVQIDKLANGRAKEEEQWTHTIAEYLTKISYNQSNDTSSMTPVYSALTLNVKPYGYVFGSPGSLIRRLSLQRAATVCPRMSCYRIIIRNTNAIKDENDTVNRAISSIERSKSLLSADYIPILAPQRANRVRMEASLVNVWTRDLLPYPGMAMSRGEHTVRGSASSVMRKLSKASIAGSFSKRSVSATNLVENSPSPSILDFQRSCEDIERQGLRICSSHSTDTTLKRSSQNRAPVREVKSQIRTGAVKGVHSSVVIKECQTMSQASPQAIRVESADEGSARLERIGNRENTSLGIVNTMLVDSLESQAS
ncbi:MAG: hypothetical protein Q9190_002231 [Brigantiaea leucoxantha]